MIYIEPELLKRVNTWLTPSFDIKTQEYIKNLIATDPAELKESFYKNLEFGTGGMRGVMGIGTNRINKYTLGKNTQGLSNYMHQELKYGLSSGQSGRTGEQDNDDRSRSVRLSPWRPGSGAGPHRLFPASECVAAVEKRSGPRLLG